MTHHYYACYVYLIFCFIFYLIFSLVFYYLIPDSAYGTFLWTVTHHYDSSLYRIPDSAYGTFLPVPFSCSAVPIKPRPTPQVIYESYYSCAVYVEMRTALTCKDLPKKRGSGKGAKTFGTSVCRCVAVLYIYV